MKILFLLGTLSLSTVCFAKQIGQNDSYLLKPSQTALIANVKLKKLPGFEVNIDSLHKGTDLSASEKHKLLMGYNIKSPIGTFNFSAGNTKMPGFVEDKKSLSASYVLKNNWSALNLSYENNNHLDSKTNRFSDPVFKVSGSFIF